MFIYYRNWFNKYRFYLNLWSIFIQHEVFETKPTLKDIFYINLSKFVWFMWTNNDNGIFKNLKEYDSKNVSFLERIFSIFRSENRLIINILFFRIVLKI